MRDLKKLERGWLLPWLWALIYFVIVPVCPARSTTSTLPEYRLRLFHTHTGERLDLVYRRGNSYVPEALAALDNYLRDHRTGAVRHYDPRVFDLLHDVTVKLGLPDSEIDVVCGYRSPTSNELLRSQGHGVALHSLHIQAMAIDIRVPGVKTSSLRDAALTLHRGGVGYYEKAGFVHVDVGRIRRW
jgi:uncharacterized protein YcbK (DUF882 family)